MKTPIVLSWRKSTEEFPKPGADIAVIRLDSSVFDDCGILCIEEWSPEILYCDGDGEELKCARCSEFKDVPKVPGISVRDTCVHLNSVSDINAEFSYEWFMEMRFLWLPMSELRELNTFLHQAGVENTSVEITGDSTATFEYEHLFGTPSRPSQPFLR